MTCAHVLDLIDAGPFAGVPGPHLAAAWEHARQCPTCGPALTMMRELETDLPALRPLAPPRDFRAGVLSRIADLPAAPAISRSSDAAAPTWQRWPAWSGAAGGAAALIALQTMTSTDVTTLAPRSGTITASLIDMPGTQPGVLVLAIGLLLYVRGLFSLTATVSPARPGAASDTDSARR